MLSVSGPCFPLAHWAGWEVPAPHSGLPGGRCPPSLLVLVARVCAPWKSAVRCAQKWGSVDPLFLLKSVLCPAPPCAHRLACSQAQCPQTQTSGPSPVSVGRAPCLVHCTRVGARVAACLSRDLASPWLAFAGDLLGWGCHSVACSDTSGGVGEATLLSIRAARSSAGALFAAACRGVRPALTRELRRPLRRSALGLVRLGPHAPRPSAGGSPGERGVWALLCAGAGSVTRPA